LDAQHAENYLRLRADEELREAIAEAQVQATADDLATTAKRCMARVAALAGALTAVGDVPVPVAESVLDHLGAALTRTADIFAGRRSPDARKQAGLVVMTCSNARSGGRRRLSGELPAISSSPSARVVVLAANAG